MKNRIITWILIKTIPLWMRWVKKNKSMDIFD